MILNSNRYESAGDDPCAYDGCPPVDPALSYAFNADCSINASTSLAAIPVDWQKADGGVAGIYIGPNVTSFGNNAFRGCYNLQEIWIPNQYINTNNYPFYDCSNLHTVNFSADSGSWKAYSFRYANALTTWNFCTASLPSGLASGTYGIFADVNNLTEIHVPANAWVGVTSYEGRTLVKDLPDYVENPISTTVKDANGDYVFSKNQTSFGNNSFAYNANVVSLKIGDNLSSVGSAFCGNCVNLVGDVTFPSGFVSGSFFGRQGANFDNITFSEGITSISSSMFLQYTGNKNIDLVMPSTLTSIGSEAFNSNDNNSWGELYLNEGLQTMGQQTFKFGSNMGNNQTLVIPSTMTSLGRWNFRGTKFNRIEVKPRVYFALSGDAFSNMSFIADNSIHVPSNATGYPATISGYTVVYDLPAVEYLISNTNFAGATSGIQTVSASSELSASLAAWKAYDNLTTTSWLSTSLPSWNKIDFGQSEAITKIVYNVRDDSGGVQAPQDYVIESSTDDLTWTTRSTVIGAPKDQNNDITHDFDDQTASARYWRIRCTVGHGENRTGLEKIEWYGIT